MMALGGSGEMHAEGWDGGGGWGVVWVCKERSVKRREAKEAREDWWSSYGDDSLTVVSEPRCLSSISGRIFLIGGPHRVNWGM